MVNTWTGKLTFCECGGVCGCIGCVCVGGGYEGRLSLIMTGSQVGDKENIGRVSLL